MMIARFAVAGIGWLLLATSIPMADAEEVGPMCVYSAVHKWQYPSPLFGPYTDQNTGHYGLYEFVPDAPLYSNSMTTLLTGPPEEMQGTLFLQVVCKIMDAVEECLDKVTAVGPEVIQECVESAADMS